MAKNQEWIKYEYNFFRNVSSRMSAPSPAFPSFFGIFSFSNQFLSFFFQSCLCLPFDPLQFLRENPRLTWKVSHRYIPCAAAFSDGECLSSKMFSANMLGHNILTLGACDALDNHIVMCSTGLLSPQENFNTGEWEPFFSPSSRNFFCYFCLFRYLFSFFFEHHRHITKTEVVVAYHFSFFLDRPVFVTHNQPYTQTVEVTYTFTCSLSRRCLSAKNNIFLLLSRLHRSPKFDILMGTPLCASSAPLAVLWSGKRHLQAGDEHWITVRLVIPPSAKTEPRVTYMTDNTA